MAAACEGLAGDSRPAAWPHVLAALLLVLATVGLLAGLALRLGA